jgi:hypothetical protein
MTIGRPKPEEYVDIHEWAQAVQAWNERNNVHSTDIVEEWNESRRNARG